MGTAYYRSADRIDRAAWHRIADITLDEVSGDVRYTAACGDQAWLRDIQFSHQDGPAADRCARCGPG